MYNHSEIEKKWSKYWEENKTFKFVDDLNKPKFYVLDMFPYPSGKGLHVGHPKGYTGTDVLSRYKRLKNFNVLHPIGWDAFGLPAEQYALTTNNHPSEFTIKNIDNFRNQLKKLGFDFDYDKEVNTTDPNYFQWTQWIFLQLYKKGLAEIKEIDVNWCAGLGTVLANEEVIINKNGDRVSERGEFPVTKKPMRQWVLKITDYANKLIEGLDEIDWPKSLKSLQTNWIGKSVGLEIDFKIKDSNDCITIFTTRPDTIYGVTYLAIAPTHKMIKKLTTNNQKEEVEKYLDEFNKTTSRELKINNNWTGVFTGSYAINPLNNDIVPIYISNYVVPEFGLGAVMGVPAHDETDFNFANNLKLEIKQVIESDKLPFIGDGKHINSNNLNGLNIEDAKNKVINEIVNLKIGKEKTNFKLKDWIFSRQRYWGEPFPVLFDENLEITLDENLPILLPNLQNFKPSGDGQSPLVNAKDWLELDINGKKYIRDTNTMPQWAGSCWYFLGYILKNEDQTYLPLNSKEAKDRLKRWMPVDIYVGGQEHAVLHLLYARFWYRFLYDIGIAPTKEPFYKVINQGIILGSDNEKMSKSKGNIISVDDVIESHGADALRLYEMFMGPFTATMSWKTEAIDGVRKWLDRVYRLYFSHDSFRETKYINEANSEILVAFNKMVKKVGDDIENFHFNTAISEMMIFINLVYKINEFNLDIMHKFAIILSCFAPYLAEEINEHLGFKTSICLMKWPNFNDKMILQEKINIPVIIDNRPRAILNVDIDTNHDDLLKIALANEKVQKYLGNKQVKDSIFVINKILKLIL